MLDAPKAQLTLLKTLRLSVSAVNSIIKRPALAVLPQRHQQHR